MRTELTIQVVDARRRPITARRLRIILVSRRDVTESASATAAAAVASYWHSSSQQVSSLARRRACSRLVNKTALQLLRRLELDRIAT